MKPSMHWPVVLISVLALLGLAVVVAKQRAHSKSGSVLPKSANPMPELRAKVFATDPKELGLAPSEKRPHVWGVVMEIGYPQATASLVALGEGTVSLYFSTGGGVIGAGEHAYVRQEAAKLIDAGEGYLDQLSPTTNFSLPQAERVRFYILTFSGPVTADAAESDLAGGKHPLSQFYMMGQNVITEIRQISQHPGK